MSAQRGREGTAAHPGDVGKPAPLFVLLGFLGVCIASLGCARPQAISKADLGRGKSTGCGTSQCALDSVFQVVLTRVDGRIDTLASIWVSTRPVLFRGVLTGIEVDTTGVPFGVFRIDSTGHEVSHAALPDDIDPGPISIDIGPEGDRVAFLRQGVGGLVTPEVMDWPSGRTLFASAPFRAAGDPPNLGITYCYFGTASFVSMSGEVIEVRLLTDDGRAFETRYLNGTSVRADWKCPDEAKLYDRSQGQFRDNRLSNGRSLAVDLVVSSTSFEYSSRMLIQGMLGFRESVLICTLPRSVGAMVAEGRESCSDGESSGAVRYEYDVGGDRWIRAESGPDAGPVASLERSESPPPIPLAVFESWQRVVNGGAGHLAQGALQSQPPSTAIPEEPRTDTEPTQAAVRPATETVQGTLGERMGSLSRDLSGWAVPDTVGWSTDYTRNNSAATGDADGDGSPDYVLLFIHRRTHAARAYFVHGRGGGEVAIPVEIGRWSGDWVLGVGVGVNDRWCEHPPCKALFNLGPHESEAVAVWEWSSTRKMLVPVARESDE